MSGDGGQFIVEDVAEAFGEDEGEDVVLVFRRVLGSANGAGGVPDPGFEGFRRRIFGHEIGRRIKGLRKEVKKPEKTLGQGQGI